MQLFIRFFESLNNKSSSFPLIIILLLLGAFLALLIVILVTIISIKKKNQLYNINTPKNPELPLPPSALFNNKSQPQDKTAQNSNNKTQNKFNKKISILVFLLGKRLVQFLVNRGYIQANSIIKSFFNATKYLKNTFGAKYKYALPWYAIVGTSQSGKSSLLQGFTQDELDSFGSAGGL